MTASCDLLVFSDLDGTLIDHDTYDHSPARPALTELFKRSAGLVLASSKTAPEMIPLRARIGAENWPAIVENGAGCLAPMARDLPDPRDYTTIRAALSALPADLRQGFTGFGDLTTSDIAALTGLSADATALAQQRSFSEPGLWSGAPDLKQAFLAALSRSGITALQGGRFLTLSLGHDKVDQMRAIIARYEPRHTIALGDAPNDRAMLEHADIGIIIANPAHPPLPPLKTEQAGRIIRTKEAGPTGWNIALLDVLARLPL